MHFTDYVVTEQSDRSTRRAIPNAQKETAKKFVHSWRITRDDIVSAGVELCTHFGIGFGVIAHAWSAFVLNKT